MKKFTSVLLLLILTLFFSNQSFSQCNQEQCPPGLADPSPSPQQACILCSLEPMNGSQGSTIGQTPNTSPAPFCGTVENNQWFAFFAPQATVEFQFQVSNCDGQPNGSGIQAEVYSTPDCNNFTSVSNCWSPGIATTGTVTATNLTPGGIYYLMIDGFAGDQCDFTITVTQPPGGGGSASLPPPGPLIGPPTACSVTPSGQGNTYFVPPLAGATSYQWEVTPPSAGFISSDPTANTIFVEWTSPVPTVATVCVTAMNTCSTSPPTCFPVQVTPVPPTIEQHEVCLGDAVICAGETFFTPGSFDVTLQSYQGCDSVVTCIIIPIAPLPPTEIKEEMCGPATYTIECANMTYSESGFYSVTCDNYQGCDSTVILELAIFEPEADVIPPDELECDPNNAMVILDGTGSSIAEPFGTTTWTWTGPSFCGPTDEPTACVDQPGTYCLTITHEGANLSCTDELCVDVFQNIEVPDEPVITGEDMLCDGAVEQYLAEVFGGPPPTGYTWTTPGGEPFTQNGNMIEVDWTGSIGGDLCVTADNDCGSSTPACLTIVISFGPEEPDLSGTDAVCDGDVETYTINNFDPDVTYNWTIPPGASLNDMGSSVTVNFDGASSGDVCIEASNGCGTLDPVCIFVEVTTVPEEPVFSSGALNLCDGTVETYCVDDVPGALGYTWTTPAGTFTAQGTCMDVDWSGLVAGQVCVTADNGCGSSTEVCVDVIVDEGPTAALSGGGAFCENSGDQIDLTVTLTGTSPWVFEYTDGTNTFTENIDVSPHIISVGTEGNYSPVSVSDQTICDGSVSGSAEVVENAQPTAVLSGSGAICQGSGDNVDLSITLTGTPNWTVNWTIDDVPQAALTITSSPFTLSITQSQAGMIELVDVTDDNDCTNTADGVSMVVVNDAPTVSDIVSTCDATNTEYVVTFEIQNGEDATYSVTPLNGTLTTSPPYIFTSNPIPSGDNYSFIVTDGNDCNPVSVDGSRLCDCTTAVGDMDQTPVEECGDGPITALYDDTNEMFDGNDILTYILHEGSGITIVNQVAVNPANPTFSFNPVTMTYGATYYVSAVIGDNDGSGGVDLSDPCLAIAQGTPIVFFEVPTAVLAGTTSICDGTDTDLEITFTGTGPWSVQYDDESGTPVQLNGITSNPFALNVEPNTTTTYTLISVNSTDCPGTVDGSALVTVNTAVEVLNVATACNITNTAYVVTFEITGGDIDSYSVSPLNGTLTTSAPFIFTSNEIPTTDGYNFLVDDANSCAPQTVEDDLVVCDCTTDVGLMDANGIEECGDGPVSPVYDNTNEAFDGDDIIQFILHTGSGTNITNIIATNTTPSFSFDAATMDYGTTYFASAVIGNDDGTGNVDLTDECLAVSPGTPITFFEVPTGELMGNEVICIGECATISVTLTGDSPWSVAFSNGIVDTTVNNIVSNPFNYEVCPTETTTYTLIDVKDENCPADFAGSATVTVNEPPTTGNPIIVINASNTGYTVSFEIMGGDPSSYTVTPMNGTISATAPFIFTSNELDCGDGYNFQIDDGNTCGPMVVSQTQVICDCTTEAGTMDPNSIAQCGSDAIDGVYLGGEILDGNDVIGFMLHAGDDQNPISTNSSGSFNYNPTTMTFGTTYFICPVAGDDTGNGNVDYDDPCLSIGACTPVVFNEIPTATLVGGADLCEGESTSLVVDFTGVGPWTLTYNAGDPITETGIMDNPYTIVVTPGASTVYTLTEVIDVNCMNTASGVAIVNVNTPPFTANTLIECDVTNTEYTVSFSINGGDPDSYLVNPAGSGAIDAGGIFTSNPIPTGQGYQFFVDDGNACGPLEIAEPIIVCDCETFAGSMNLTALTECGETSITAVHNANHVLDGNDVLCFVLHNGDEVPIMTNSEPTFTFDPATMVFGQTYFISAVAGNDSGSGCPIDDPSDPCFDISAGVEVTFNEVPTAILSGDASICNGETTNLSITFTGSPAWSLTYDEGGTPVTINSITDNPLIIPVTPGSTTDYNLVSVSSMGCGGTVDGAASVIINEVPEVTNLSIDCDLTNTFYTVTFDITGGDDASYVVSGSATGTLTGATFVSDQIPSQSPYQFDIDDSNSCGPTQIDGSFACDCATDAGTMNPDPQQACIDTPISTFGNNDEVLDGDDNLVFILHTGNADVLGDVLMTSATPDFSFAPPLQEGVTYFISAVAGNDDGSGGVDLGDDCLSVAIGTAVTWQPFPIADAGAVQELTCEEIEATIGGASSTGADIIYEWTADQGSFPGNPGEATPTIGVPGNYTLTVTNSATGCSATDQVTVILNDEPPFPSASISDASCFGDNDGFITVDSVTGGVGPYVYSLNGSPFQTSPTFSSLGAGDHVVIVEDAKGCQFSLDLKVGQPDELEVVLSTNLEGEEDLIDFGDSLILKVEASIPFTTLDQVIWSPAGLIECDSCDTNVVYPEVETTFSITVQKGSCSASDDMTVFVRRNRPVFVPNVFSPNDDGVNDRFQIFVGASVVKVHSFLVFNRWGETVYDYFNFDPNDPNPDVGRWDGKHRGKTLNPAVFTWFALIEFNDGAIELYEGDVTLAR